MKNDYGGSHTPKEIKDLWQTPKPVFRGMDREFEFVADVAANKQNALVPRYITEEMNTLTYPWGGGGNAWGLCVDESAILKSGSIC